MVSKDIFFYNNPTPSCICNMEGKVLEINQAWIKFLGWSLEELHNSLMYSFIHKDDVKKFVDKVSGLKDSKIKSFRLQLRLSHKNGEWIWFDWSVWKDVESEYIFAIAKDQSKKIIAEKERRKESHFLESILNNLPDMIFVKEVKELRFIRMNKTGYQLLGLTPRDIIGKSDNDFFPKEQADFFVQKDREVIESRTTLHIPEEPINTPNGVRILHTRKVGLYDEHGNPEYLLGISTDITRSKQIELELKQNEAKLIQASKMATLGEMAGGVAHEINNPLSVISGKCTLLRKRLAKHNVPKELELESNLEKIQQMCARIEKIVTGLRIFSRDDSKDLRETCAVNEIIDMTISLVFERYNKMGISIFYPSYLPESLTLLASPIQISQILVNLVNNSAHAIETSQEKKISIDVDATDTLIRFIVSDSGPGMSEEVQKKIFQPFYTTKKIGKGTGLGLSISKGIAESHNGKLFFDNTRSQTTFILELPRPNMKAQAA